MDEMEELDTLKTKILKYVLYKKRTEAEIRQKFSEFSGKMLDDIIEFLNDNNYINDEIYIDKAINEFKRLKEMSIKEIEYKLLSKGIHSNKIEEYISKNKEDLLEYESNSAKKIAFKKQNIMSEEEIIQYLKKKGYKNDIIKQAINTKET